MTKRPLMRFLGSLAAAMLTAAGIGLAVGDAVAQAQAPAVREFNIAPQSLESALRHVAKENGLQLLYDPKDIRGLNTPGVRGSMSARQAVAKLLEGTGVAVSFGENGTVILKPNEKGGQAANPTLLAQAQVQAASASESSKEQLPVKKGETITVTGTNIRGGTSTASPTYTYSREAIDQAGAGNVTDLIQRIPQNFSGVASETTAQNVAGPAGGINEVGGTGINLRGLGPSATLVLMNGRRVAPNNTMGDFVDVSMIPMAAIERIEIVPDGASAIYGSDAVGGVVNFIMRKDFQGAETRLRYGAATGGVPHEEQVAQTIGRRWGSGSALLSYEYYQRNKLFAKDRDFTNTALEPSTLLPDQERHALFASVDQTIGDGIDLFGYGTYAHRSSSFLNTNQFAPLGQGVDSEIGSYNAVAGGRTELSRNLGLELSISYAASDTHNIYTRGGVSQLRDKQVDSKVLSLDGKLDGQLLRLFGEPVLFAVGGQYRKEGLDSIQQGARAFNPTREISAAFAELNIPVVGPPASSPSANTIEVNVAGRFERYSDFGSTTNPKVGVVWNLPFGIKLRGTGGRSFKAPLLNDLNPATDVFAFQQQDPNTGQPANILLVFGGNPDLKPEKARSWTFGFDLSPRGAPEFRAGATYYNIHYSGLITNPAFQGFPIFANGLGLEATLGPGVIQRNPSVARVQQIIGAASFFLDATGVPGGVSPSSIVAIEDVRQNNFSDQKTRGIDFYLSYASDTRAGKLEMGLEGTYILKNKSQFAISTPVISLLNTPYNPIDLKMRLRSILRQGSLTVAAFVNYSDSYNDTNVTPARRVKSWTTGDATVTYSFGTAAGWLRDTSIALAVLNITDADPPFVTNGLNPPIVGFNYDGANTTPLGRLVSLQVIKRW